MLYITINNLISDEEIPELEEYLTYLNEIQPDAILIQDLAVAQIVKKTWIEYNYACIYHDEFS